MREVRAAVAEIRARHSEAAGDETNGAVAVGADRSAAVSSPASPNNPGGATAQGPGVRHRDPRLGRYRNLGDFLTDCDKRLHLNGTAVRKVAGLLPADDAQMLLDFEGGLNALFDACNAAIREGARA